MISLTAVRLQTRIFSKMSRKLFGTKTNLTFGKRLALAGKLGGAGIFVLAFKQIFCDESPPNNNNELEEKNDGGNNNNEDDDGTTLSNDKGDTMITNVINRIWPTVAELGMGGFFGWAAGVAAKKVTMQAAYLIGICFMGLQVLSYYGYINISWRKVQSDLYSMVDQNNDGKLDSKDAITAWKNFRRIMTTNLPSSGGFAAGFFFGFSNTSG